MSRLLLIALFSLVIVLSSSNQVSADIGVSQTTRYPTQRRISEVKELPTTGIPLLAWSLLGLIPVGKKMTRYGKENKTLTTPQDILNKKLFMS
jgi:hypothetical protein